MVESTMNVPPKNPKETYRNSTLVAKYDRTNAKAENILPAIATIRKPYRFANPLTNGPTSK